MYPTDCHSEEGKFGNNIVCTHRNKCAPRLKGEAILTLCWFPEQYVWQRLKILLVVKWFKLCRNQLTDVEQTLSDSCSWWIFHPHSSHRLLFFLSLVLKQQEFDFIISSHHLVFKTTWNVYLHHSTLSHFLSVHLKWDQAQRSRNRFWMLAHFVDLLRFDSEVIFPSQFICLCQG